MRPAALHAKGELEHEVYICKGTTFFVVLQIFVPFRKENYKLLSQFTANTEVT